MRDQVLVISFPSTSHHTGFTIGIRYVLKGSEGQPSLLFRPYLEPRLKKDLESVLEMLACSQEISTL